MRSIALTDILKSLRTFFFNYKVSIIMVTIPIIVMFALRYSMPKSYRIYSSLNKQVSFNEINPNYTHNLLSVEKYIFKKNDNLWDIAKKYGINVDTILSINFNDNASPANLYKIKEGKTILIPHINGVFENNKDSSIEKIAGNYNMEPNIIRLFNDFDELEDSKIKDLTFVPWKQFSLQRLAQSMGHLFFCPLKDYSRISSVFGMRIHPITKQRIFHKGIDIAASEGVPVYSALGGEVIFAGYKGAYGNLVIIQHKNNLTTCYAHLSKIAVHSGQQLGLQVPVGNVGSTGLSTGNHLHYEVRKNGSAIDPRMLTSLKISNDINTIPN